MTISTKFNFNFTTLKTIFKEKRTLNTALIQQNQRIKKNLKKQRSLSLTSSNISIIAKRKITNIKKTSKHH